MSEAIHVLIVEDLPSDAELSQREINKVLGSCRFRRVETREEYSAVLEERWPALIVSDFKLPSFDGLTALKLALERCPDVPFIIVTGSMNEDTAVECMKAGAWDYVIKEHIKRLGSAVLGALEQKRLRQDRLKAEAALRRSEQRLREAQRLGRIGHWELDPETQRIRWSDMVYTLYGRDPGLGPPTVEEEAAYYSAEDAKRLHDCANRTIETGEPYEIDVSVRVPGGRVVDVIAIGSRVEDSGGRLVRLLGTIQDITERKRAEKALKESEERYAALFGGAAEGILVADLETRSFVFANPAICRMLGYSEEEIKRLGVEDIHPAESLEHVLGEFEAQARGEKSLAADLPCRRKDGSVIYADVTASRMALNGRRYNVGFFSDITERKQAEAQREKLEEQLRASQKMEAIGSLAGGIAHDFNNLLSVILTYTGFVLDGVREGDPVRDDLLEVKNAAERAVTLTRQLLAFGRKQLLQPVTLDLNQIAAGVEKMLRRILGEDIDLVQVLAPDLGLTLADPGQIEQVVMNLVVNARDAMPKGGKLTIETSNVEIDEEYAARHVAVQPGPYVMLAVTDTGCGMDEQTKGRLFEPFFTTKEEGKGTGLGLSTVYGIVKQSGGNIWVYSEPGQGTTFKIYLPRQLAATTATAIKPPGGPRRSTGTETILVVEDEEALRRVARRALDAAGYTVLTAADGEEALQTCAQHVGDIHLLLTDVVMPRMSGRTLAQELSRTRPSLKVLYMSGYTDDAIVHHGVLDAGTNFLAKPFTAAGLTSKVREVLDGSITNLGDAHVQAVEDEEEARSDRGRT